ncbi:hypothetical protein niasHT_026861 [Heterodera trifolii]|uniref:Fido domain-containing protein n=1 Tax=Heterodera trifolii TaxID=157864 RepID=A0ABD2JQB1_9BILA
MWYQILELSRLAVGQHNAPEYDDVPKLMDDFLHKFNHHLKTNMDGPELAARAHFELVHIHPYLDGNGRVARLVANWVLIQRVLPMFIPAEEARDEYNANIALAVRGRNEGHATGLDLELNRNGDTDWLKPFINMFYVFLQIATENGAEKAADNE